MKRSLSIIIAAALLFTLSAGAEPAGLKAGAGKALIDPKPGMPLAGYGDRMSKPSTGVHDHVYARALILESQGIRVGLVGCDMLLVTIELREELIKRVADLNLTAVDVTATHTHSSIGGYVDNKAYEIAVMGKYDPRAREIILSGMEKALRQAASAMVPAKAGAAEGAAPGISRNRRHEGGPTDQTMRVLGVWDKGGKLLALIMNHGAHPTILGGSNLQASGDFAGRAEAVVEERNPGAVAIFMNSGLGDQSARGDESLPPFEEVDQVGARVADNALSIIASATPDPDPALVPLTRRFAMPPVKVRNSFECFGGLSPVLKRLGRSMLREEGMVTGLRVGKAFFVFVSGEISNEVRENIAAQAGGEPAFVVSHANDYYGYVLTPEDYAQGGYESCMNFYGPGFGPVLEDEARAMAQEGNSEAPHECPCTKHGM